MLSIILKSPEKQCVGEGKDLWPMSDSQQETTATKSPDQKLL